jgi:hypothetical protein
VYVCEISRAKEKLKIAPQVVTGGRAILQILNVAHFILSDVQNCKINYFLNLLEKMWAHLLINLFFRFKGWITKRITSNGQILNCLARKLAICALFIISLLKYAYRQKYSSNSTSIVSN